MDDILMAHDEEMCFKEGIKKFNLTHMMAGDGTVSPVEELRELVNSKQKYRWGLIRNHDYSPIRMYVATRKVKRNSDHFLFIQLPVSKGKKMCYKEFVRFFGKKKLVK